MRRKPDQDLQTLFSGSGSGRLLPPTSAHPAYASMRLRYYQGPPTMQSALYRSAQNAADSDSQQPVRATHQAPDGKPVITVALTSAVEPACRSTCWIVDTDGAAFEAMRFVLSFSRSTDPADTRPPVGFWTVLPQAGQPIGSVVRATQEQYLRDRLAGITCDPGFRVECCLPREHDGDCAVQDWAWNRKTGRVRL